MYNKLTELPKVVIIDGNVGVMSIGVKVGIIF
jgi:hypothetical protein